MKRVYIYTLGCKSNQYEARKIMEDFCSYGFYEAENMGNADIIIINSCCITNAAQAKSRRYARRASREKRDSLVVLTGCFATIVKEKLDFIDLIIPHKDKLRSVEIIMDYLGIKRIKDKNIKLVSKKTRAILKIQDGCNRRCTYCIIPDIRGNEVYFSLDSIIEETKILVDKGFHEIVLSGMVTGNWKSGDLKFIDLLKKILEMDGFRLRISSLDVRDIDDELVEFIAKNDRICNHLHIPLQSGSEKILKKMNRRYSPDRFRHIVNLSRKLNESLSITTDVICGFPGESSEDFEKSYSLLNELPIFEMHVFPFSSRPGTPASTFKERVAEGIKKERVERLIKLGISKKREHFERNLNKRVSVLIEKSGEKWSKGFSENYIEVRIEGKVEENRFCNVKLVKFNENNMFGVIV